MSGLMNNYLYGKAGKADFTPDQLPANRFELFLEMMRIRFSGLVAMNLFSVLISLPALVWSVISYSALVYNTEQMIASGQGPTSALDPTILLYLLIMVPCIMIITVFNTGVFYILRNWARDQHTFTISDYKDALKANWKQALLLGLINGLSLPIVYIAYTYYGTMGVTGGSFWYVPQMLVVILLCVWWMANMLITPMMVTYEMSFKTLIRNSIVMTLGRLPWSLLFWGLSVAIPAVILLFVPYGVVIAALIYVLLGFSLTNFVYVSYANSCFDRFLNPRIEGAQVNMGLRDPNYAEEEIEVTDEDIKNL